MRLGFLAAKLSRLAMNLEPFIQRSKLADQKIQILRNQIENLKKNNRIAAIENEAKRLEQENKTLQAEVDDLKNQLKLAEMRNGKIQVPLPSEKPSLLTKHITKAAYEPKKSEPDKKKQQAEKPKKKQSPPKPKESAPVDVSRLDFRVGLIVKAEVHPDANTLYVEEVDTGEEEHRTIISGLIGFVPLEEMQNRLVIIMMNLKPVKMRGILSQGMVMCACTPDKIEIIKPPSGCVPGDCVTFEGYPGEPDVQLNPKKKVWEQVKPDLRTNENKVACYKGVPFTIAGKGVCTAETMANTEIH